MPAVSVLMPVHDAGRFLAPALDSILRQSFADLELICVDDGSGDGSPAVLSACADPRLRVARQERAGIVAALNRGLALAQGRYIARMDADDEALPDRVARQVAYLDAHPDVALVGSGYTLIDQDGREHGTWVPPLAPDEVAAALAKGNCIAHPTVLFRHMAVGGFDPVYRAAFRYAEDHDLWLRLAERARLANLPEPLLRYRRRFDAMRFGQYEQQARSQLAAQALAAKRRAGGADPAAGWDLVTPERLATLGVAETAVRAAVRRAVLAEGRQARRAGYPASAAACARYAHGFAPRGEGAGAWLAYALQQAKLWV